MPAPSSFDYAVVRVVPHVDRGEFINAGVILFCRTQRFLGAQVALNHARLVALAPTCHPADIEAHLNLIPAICQGAGPIGQLALAERFHWLVAPRSTVIQVSAVHCGLCYEPQTALAQLFAAQVG